MRPSSAALAVVIVAAALAILPRGDDVHWHLAVGEEILDSGSVPTTNAYSWTAPEEPWTAHSWGAEALFALVHRGAGVRGLVALSVALLALTCLLYSRLSSHVEVEDPVAGAAVVCLCVPLLLVGWSVRPYLFAGAALAALTLILDRRQTAGSAAGTLILCAVWANLHGSAPVAIVLCVAAALSSWRRQGGSVGWLHVAAAVVGNALVPTPLDRLELLGRYAGLVGDRSFVERISEWQHPSLTSAPGALAAAAVVATAAVVVLSRRRPTARSMGVALLFAALAAEAVRNVALLPAGLAPLWAQHLPPLLARLSPPQRLAAAAQAARAARGHAVTVVAAAAVAATMVVPASWPVSYRSMTGVDHAADLSPRFYPRGLLHHLAQGGGLRSRRIYNHLDWGGAMIRALAPLGGRVFIDQRNDCYPDAVWRDYLTVHDVAPGWRAVLQRWDTDRVAVRPWDDLARTLRQEPGWSVEYEDHQAVLFAQDL